MTAIGTFYERIKGFPREEIYSLTDQIRRSSRSIGSNINEAWHKRRDQAHFASKLTDADGEQAETQHWLNTALACGYIGIDVHRSLLGECMEIGRMLGGIIANPEAFCKRWNLAT